MNLSFGYKTDIGQKRESNQDSFRVLGRAELDGRLDALFLVADGMGGMGGESGGAMASSIVAKTMPEAIYELLTERYSRTDNLDVSRLMRELITRVNYNVCTRQVNQANLKGMGTTCTAALVKDGVLTVGNVGDSRAYLLREGQLRQITEDHSEIWQEVLAGKMTREEARRSRFRNSITRAIGLQPDVTPDIYPVSLEEGDTVLLCSDGLTFEVSDAQIARILASAPDAQEACNRLVDTALRNGGSDNITVIVLRCGPFTPIVLPDDGSDIADEDSDTDPAQEWRNAPPPSTNGRPTAPSPRREEAVEEGLPPSRRASAEAEETPGASSLARALILLLLAIVVAEAGALWLTLKNRTVAYPNLNADGSAAGRPTEFPTDREFLYDDPQLIYDKRPLRETPLRIDGRGNFLAVAQDGTLLRIGANGKEVALNGTPPLSAVTPNGPASRSRAAKNVYMTLDASGNRYQTDPAKKCIMKFNLKGVRVLWDIGKGMLIAPGDLVVNARGDIYVIDDHRLKKLSAVTTLSQRNAEQREQQEHRNGTD